MSVCEDCEVVALRHLGQVVSEVVEDVKLSLLLGDGRVELGLDDRDGVGGYLDGLALSGSMRTSPSTSTTSLEPSSAPTRGLTLTKTLIEVAFSLLSLFII